MNIEWTPLSKSTDSVTVATTIIVSSYYYNYHIYNSQPLLIAVFQVVCCTTVFQVDMISAAVSV